MRWCNICHCRPLRIIINCITLKHNCIKTPTTPDHYPFSSLKMPDQFLTTLTQSIQNTYTAAHNILVEHHHPPTHSQVTFGIEDPPTETSSEDDDYCVIRLHEPPHLQSHPRPHSRPPTPNQPSLQPSSPSLYTTANWWTLSDWLDSSTVALLSDIWDGIYQNGCECAEVMCFVGSSVFKHPSYALGSVYLD